ncbi:MAG: ERAP1-like C-terminal domain-containing protein, partial [Mycobacteriales bacterium]
SLPRALCWAAAWDMCRDGELAARDYLALVENGVGGETDIGLVQSLLSKAQLAVSSYGDPANRVPALTSLATTCERLLRAAEAGSDLQLAFASAFATSATTPDQLAAVDAIFSGSDVLPGLVLDTDLRWTLLTELVARGTRGDADIDAELGRDRTAAGEKRAATARTSRPTEEAKEQAYQAVMRSAELSNHIVMATLMGFWRASQADLVRPYVARFFADVRDVWETHSTEMAHSITELFFPASLVEPETLAACDALIAATGPGHSGLRRLLTEGRDGLLRAQRCREVDAAVR